MKKKSWYHVKKRTLLAIGCAAWMMAGINVFRMGIMAYFHLEKISIFQLFLSLLVFGAFGTMFYKISRKHLQRIQAYEAPLKPFWYFFDGKAYMIMAVMMSTGIWLRTSKVAAPEFIAIFYTGLGFALTLAGIFFGVLYFRYTNMQE